MDLTPRIGRLRRGAGVVTRPGLPQAVSAEWIKLRSVRSSTGMVLAALRIQPRWATFLICAWVDDRGRKPRPPGRQRHRPRQPGGRLARADSLRRPGRTGGHLRVLDRDDPRNLRRAPAAPDRAGREVARHGSARARGGLLTAAACFLLGQSLLRGNGFDYAGRLPARVAERGAGSARRRRQRPLPGLPRPACAGDCGDRPPHRDGDHGRARAHVRPADRERHPA